MDCVPPMAHAHASGVYTLCCLGGEGRRVFWTVLCNYQAFDAGLAAGT